MKKERAESKIRDFKVINIEDINENSGHVDFVGKLFSIQMRKTRKGATMFVIGVGHNGAGIFVRAMIQERQKNKLNEYNEYKVGFNVRVTGRVDIDQYDKSVVVVVSNIEQLPPDELRIDDFEGPKKRIELHAHTKMSVMDGIGTMDGYLKLAKNMGHTAFGVTDHGVVQAFPDAQKYGTQYGIKNALWDRILHD